jgi:hypothetical protein
MINIVYDHILVKLTHKPGINIDYIKQTQPSVFLEYMVDDVEQSDPDVKHQHSTQ